MSCECLAAFYVKFTSVVKECIHSFMEELMS